MGPEQDGSENVAQVPSDLQYTDSISRTEEIGISPNDAMQIVTEKSMCDYGLSTNAGHKDSPRFARVDSSQESTQARHDAEEKQRLQKMMPVG